MPAFQAASSVSWASSSGRARCIFPSGAVPNPNIVKRNGLPPRVVKARSGKPVLLTGLVQIRECTFDRTRDGRKMGAHGGGRKFRVARAQRVDDALVLRECLSGATTFRQRQPTHAVEWCARRIEKPDRARHLQGAKDGGV